MRKKTLIVIFLSLFWFISTIIYIKNKEFSFTALEGRNNSGSLSFSHDGEMIKGDKVYGHFLSQYPYLGTISVRFSTFYRINSDFLTFRIKESSATSWYYQASYKTDQFQPDKLFPFGFPVIKDSQGKVYQFELESENGTTGSGVYVNGTFPAFVDKHVFPRSSVLSSLPKFVYYFYNKIVNIIGDKDVRINSLSFIFPLTAYIIFIELGNSVVIITLFIALASIYLANYKIDTPNLVFLSILFLWICETIKKKIKSDVTVSFSLIYFSLSVIYIILGNRDISEKYAVWSVLFLIYSTIQIYLEYLGVLHNSLDRRKYFLYFRKLVNLSIITFKSTHKEIQDKNSISPSKLINIILANIEHELRLSDTSRRFSKIVVLLNKLFPYVIIISNLLIINSILSNLFGRYHFYNDFFVHDQLNKFYRELILPTILMAIFTYIIVLLIRRVLQIKSFRYALLLYLILFSWGSDRIFDYFTKNIRENVIIWTIAPNDISEPWVDVTVRGRNFRDNPFRSTVTVNGTEQRIIKWSDREIVFRTDPNITKSGTLVISRNDGIRSNSVEFKYTGNR